MKWYRVVVCAYLWGIFVALLSSETHVRPFISPERIGIMRIYPESYETYSIYFSEGQQFDGKKMRTLWSRPRYRHFKLEIVDGHIHITANKLEPSEYMDSGGNFGYEKS